MDTPEDKPNGGKSTASKRTRRPAYQAVKGQKCYFRLRIPQDLKVHYGKTEVGQALGDVTPAQAKVLNAQLRARWLNEFATVRHALGLTNTPPPPPPTAAPVGPAELPVASMEEVKALARKVGQSMLQADEEIRIHGDPRIEEVPGFGPLQMPMSEALPRAIRGDGLELIHMVAEDALQHHGRVLPTDPVGRRTALYAFAMEMGKAQKAARQRDEGEPIETPEPPELPASLVESAAATVPLEKRPLSALRMRDLFALWRDSERSRPPKTVLTAERMVGIFEEIMGNIPIADLTKADGLIFKQRLLASPDTSDHKAAKVITWIKTFINHEVKTSDRMPTNPWKGLDIEIKPTAKARSPWKDADIVRLLESPLFTAYALPKSANAAADAAYWVPLLGAYTGARLTELAQLRIDDVRQSDGVWFIRFAVSEDWQSLKKDSSWRTIPVAPELVRLGFPEYCAAMAKAGHTRIFPKAAVSEQNNAGGGLSKWFSTFKTAQGFGPEYTFHGWRHTVVTKLRRAGAEGLMVKHFVGHAREGDNEATYSHIEPEDLIGTAALLVYDGLNLPKVWPPQDWKAPPLSRTERDQGGPK